MTIVLDHTIVPARDAMAGARQIAELLGVPWGRAAVGPFVGVYVNEGLTLDFIETAEDFPVQHFCFRVDAATFDAILGRLREAKIAYRSTVFGEADYKVDPTYGNVYWNEPAGHMWEILQVSYARQA